MKKRLEKGGVKMSKTFTYKKVISERYNSKTDEYEEEIVEVEYEVEDAELLDAIVDFIYEDYFKEGEIVGRNYAWQVTQCLHNFIQDNNLFDKFFKEYEKDLKDAFESEALE